MSSAIEDRYPVIHHLEDDAKVTFSPMSESDREELSKFLSRLAKFDLAYLQVDITQPEVQRQWLDNIAKGISFCVCAYDPASLVGYASVQVAEANDIPSGEIRVNISPGYRSRGLGRLLIAEIFWVAKELNLSEVTARMMSDQYGAKSAFERLGFSQQQVLENYVKDAKGESKDLIVMSSSTREA